MTQLSPSISESTRRQEVNWLAIFYPPLTEHRGEPTKPIARSQLQNREEYPITRSFLQNAWFVTGGRNISLSKLVRR